MREYSNYLFDLDGTLIESLTLIISCFQFSLGSLGIKRSDEYIRESIGLPLAAQFQRLLQVTEHDEHDERGEDGHLSKAMFKRGVCCKSKGKGFSAKDIKLVSERHMQYQKLVYSDFIYVYAGVKELLACLKRAGKRLAIVTSRYPETANMYISMLQLDKFFEHVVTPLDVSKPKPHGEHALEALNMLKLESGPGLGRGHEDTLFIGRFCI